MYSLFFSYPAAAPVQKARVLQNPTTNTLKRSHLNSKSDSVAHSLMSSAGGG